MNLSDNEKRDVIKYLKADKPLPDKYRFLIFEDSREVELLWNGKTDEVTNTVLPFQTIEHIDEPRSDNKKSSQFSLFDTSGRQVKGWTNKLIWGDNKLILSSLKSGPLRKQIEEEGGLKLIYIDPPFDVGADFSMNVEIGDESFTKKPSVIEEIAFRDTWGKGTDSFMAMIYERLKLMHSLLAEDGVIYVHCDYRLSSYVKLLLDEVFGKNNFLNEIIWQGTTGDTSSKNKKFIKSHDTLLFYEKTLKNHKWNDRYQEMNEGGLKPYKYQDEIGRYRWTDSSNPGKKGYIYSLGFGEKMPKNGYRMPKETAQKWLKTGILKVEKDKVPCIKRYLNVKGVRCKDVWGDLKSLQSTESLNYPTQKPIKLIERIIKASSDEGDLVADFFCGSGTTLAVAEKLGRKWIGSDLGRFSIHTSRKRMIGVQRDLKKEGKDFRAFEILNIGKYEREHYINVNEDLREEEKRKQQENKEKEFIKLILSAYKAEPVDSFNVFVGKKRDRMIAIGPLSVPVTNDFLEQIIEECKEKKITKVDILGFEYEMGIDFESQKKHGINIQFRIIPREVFDKKAVEKGQVRFYDVAYIEFKPIIRGRGNNKTLSVELKDFSVFYNQENTGEVEEKLKNGGSKIIIEDGNVVKITKNKDTNLIEKEILTEKWMDWIDYWSVDFDFESKKEIIKIRKKPNKQEKLANLKEAEQLEFDNFEERWTGNYIFENEWQSFRTKKDRSLELVSSEKEVEKGKKIKIAVKVVDIFGNDTTKVIEIKV